MKINASITDFPLLSAIETSFREYKKAGVDGVEIVLGLKSRNRIKEIAKLSKKYDLPITSIHQPPWSFLGMYFDGDFVEYALTCETKKIVFHPLAFHSFSSSAMKHYFERLAKLQEKYDIHVMLENMSPDVFTKKLHQFSGNTMVPHIQKLNDVADTYGFLLTYDSSHAQFINPPKEKIFQEILPKIGNIHLSSFTPKDHHLPLTMGNLDSEGFINYLYGKKYQGLLTLEVYYPRWAFRTQESQFQAIADSVKVFRKITDTLS